MQNKSYLYDIGIKIGENTDNISHTITDVTIIMNTDTPYPIISINMNMHKPIFDEISKISNKNDIELTITPKVLEKTDLKTITMKLIIYSESHSHSPNMEKDQTKSPVYVQYNIQCIPKDAYNLCYKQISRIFHDKTGQEIIDDLTEGNVKYLTPIKNTKKIEQIIFPNFLLNECIHYLMDTVGLYSGVNLIQYTSDGKLYIGDFNKLDLPEIIIYHVSGISGYTEKDLQSLTENENSYAVYNIIPIKSTPVTMQTVNTGFKYRVVVKPDDDLAVIKTIDKQKIADDGIINMGGGKNKDLLIIDDIKNNSYINKINDIGFDGEDETWINSKISSSMLSEVVKINIICIKKLDDFMIPGRFVSIKTNDPNQIQYDEKYNLVSSTYFFEKKQDNLWNVNAEIVLARGRDVIT